MEARIPFDGFYESIWSHEVDSTEEQAAESLANEEYQGFEASEIQEIIFKHASYNLMFHAIADKYVDAFQFWLESETGVRVEMRFNAMTSPREYNFETDRIFVEVELSAMQALMEAVGRDKVAARARRMFTSCSGFISFYNPDIETWGELETWDHNQLYAIFMAAIDDKELSWELLESLREPIYSAFNGNVDWDAVYRDIQHAIDVQNGEAENDARKFPNEELSTEQYVKEFEELNNLKGV